MRVQWGAGEEVVGDEVCGESGRDVVGSGSRCGR